MVILLNVTLVQKQKIINFDLLALYAPSIETKKKEKNFSLLFYQI